MENYQNQGLIALEGRATYERIVNSIRGLESEEGIRQIGNFLLVYPEFAQAYNDLAVLYYQAGDKLRALANYEKAHKLDPRNLNTRKNLADFYFTELGWADDASHIYLDILKDNPFDTETLNALGDISSRIGRSTQARQFFSRTLELDPVNMVAREQMQRLGPPLSQPPSRVQMIAAPQQPVLQQQIFEPPPSYQQTLQTVATPPPVTDLNNIPPNLHTPSVSPTMPAAEPVTPPKAQKTADERYSEALMLARSGHKSDALRLLETLTCDCQTFAPAWNDLGVLLSEQGDNERAERCYREANRLQPENTVYIRNLADLLFVVRGDREAAIKLYLELLRYNPKDVETMTAVAGICIEEENFSDASFFLEKVLLIEPWNMTVRNDMNRLRSLTEQQNPVVVRSPEEMLAAARSHFSEGRLAEARVELETVLVSNQNNPVAHNDMGVVCQRLADSDAAYRHYLEAVRLAPANPEFRKNLADFCFVELGRTDDAINLYLELFKEYPRDIEVLINLARISQAVGHPEEAKIFVRRALELEPWNREARDFQNALQSNVFF